MGNFAKPTILAVIAVTAAFAGAAPPLANVPRRGHWGDLDNKRDCTTVGVKICQLNDTHTKFDDQYFLRNPDGTLVKVSHPSEQPKAETLSPPVAEAKPQRLDVISHSTNSTNSNQTPAPVSQKNTPTDYVTPIATSFIALVCLLAIKRYIKQRNINMFIPIANGDQIPMEAIIQLASITPLASIPAFQLQSNGASPVVVNLNSQLTFAPASGASDPASELPLPPPPGSPPPSPRPQTFTHSPLTSGLTQVDSRLRSPPPR